MTVTRSWGVLEIVVFLVLVICVVFWDLRFQTAQRRWLRMSCWLVAIISLLILYLEPAFKVVAPKRVGVLFTDPITEQKQDSIFQNRDLIKINSPIDISREPFSIDLIHLYGDGLESWELDALEGYEVDFHNSDFAEGVKTVNLPKITEGLPFELTGELYIKGNLRLALVDPQGNVVYKNMSPENSVFDFTSRVKATGLYTYQLIGFRDQDTLFRELLPVQVIPSRQANVLMLGSYPSFEWNYLKNHLADLGFGVSSRFQLSQDIFHSEFLNMSSLNLNTINPKLLESFKLLIIDGKTFAGLNKKQRRYINRAVDLAEMGLFLMIDELSDLQNLATVNTLRGEGEVIVKAAEKQISLLKLPFSVSDSRWEKIELQGREVGAYTSQGIGKVGFSFLTNSHVLELQGAPGTFGQLWDKLLSPIIGFEIDDDMYYLPQFIFLNQQVEISFNYAELPSITIEGQPIAPINSPFRPDLWSVNYWPSKGGWHTIAVGGQEEAYFFVHESKDWMTLQRYEKQRANHHFLATNKREEKPDRMIWQLVSRWIPFTIFLLAMTGLWLERKFN